MSPEPPIPPDEDRGWLYRTQDHGDVHRWEPAGGRGAQEHPLSLLLFAWMRGPRFAQAALGGSALFCLILAVVDLFRPRGLSTDIVHLPMFHAVFGACALSAIVLSGWPLGRLLRRGDYPDDENEYGTVLDVVVEESWEPGGRPADRTERPDRAGPARAGRPDRPGGRGL